MKSTTLTLFSVAATLLFAPALQLSAETIVVNPTQLDAVALVETDQSDGSLMWVKWGPREAVIGNPKNEVTAKTQIQIPASGKYYVWVKYSIHAIRSKPFSVVVGNHSLPFAWLPYGEEGEEKPEIYAKAIRSSATKDAVWTCQEINLEGGETTLELTAVCNPPEKRDRIIPHPPAVWEIQITNDSSYAPAH